MILGLLKHTRVITSFVLIMVLLSEYINVQTRGSWQLAVPPQNLSANKINDFAFVWIPGKGASARLKLLRQDGTLRRHGTYHQSSGYHRFSAAIQKIRCR
jgi:hypothetical protein